MKEKNKKRLAKLIIFAMLISTLILGFMGIPPFGSWEMIGDVVGPKFELPAKIPIYPLVMLSNFLEAHGNHPLLNLFSESIYLLLAIIVIITYYYLLSSLIVYGYYKIILKDPHMTKDKELSKRP